ncbi:hypothetical protein KR52_09195 [Synechococcus sp. KORDI-52]|nr:hypothetical protein KR52_09195 [Synechococcus sp. KORDI-52]
MAEQQQLCPTHAGDLLQWFALKRAAATMEILPNHFLHGGEAAQHYVFCFISFLKVCQALPQSRDWGEISH